MTSSPESSTTMKPITKSTTNSSRPSSTSQTTLPVPTPWYSPAGPFDWWGWQGYKTKPITESSKILNTTQTSTTTTTTTTTTVIINSTASTRTSPTTNIASSSEQNPTTTDWFGWPHVEFTSTVKGRSDYDDDYSEWPDYFATTKIQPEMTSNSLIFFPPERPRKKFQQMNYLPTKLTARVLDYLTTNPTPQFVRSQFNGKTIIRLSPTIAD